MIIVFWKPYGVLSQFTPEVTSRWDTLARFGFPAGVYPIGRLDADSEGVLLLSDEPSVATRLLQGATPHQRTYAVQVEGTVTPEACHRLSTGIRIQNYTTRPAAARAVSPPNIPERDPAIRYRAAIPTSWLELSLTEGKNRQVRRMTAAVGLPTLRLIRVKIGSIGLDGLLPGMWRFCTDEERTTLGCLPGVTGNRKGKSSHHRDDANPHKANKRLFGELDGKRLFRRR
ncbi:MAG: pseudouridine synthase [Candidatus Kapabacteria bacterium]|nr:pseudouridine synthase [Candidatus Kapabacteria bacterium]